MLYSYIFITCTEALFLRLLPILYIFVNELERGKGLFRKTRSFVMEPHFMSPPGYLPRDLRSLFIPCQDFEVVMFPYSLMPWSLDLQYSGVESFLYNKVAQTSKTNILCSDKQQDII